MWHYFYDPIVRNRGQIWLLVLKAVSATFLLVFFKSKREHLSNYEKCFLFHFKSSFRSRENQILEVYIFKFYDVIKFLSINERNTFH